MCCSIQKAYSHPSGGMYPGLGEEGLAVLALGGVGNLLHRTEVVAGEDLRREDACGFFICY